MAYLKDQKDSGVTSASQVAVVGDRLFTDVLMANMMGSHSIWIKDGVVEEKGLVRTSEAYGQALIRLVCPSREESSRLSLEERISSTFAS